MTVLTDGRSMSRGVSFAGDIKLVRGYDDLSPVLVRTGFQTMWADWSNSGEVRRSEESVLHCALL